MKKFLTSVLALSMALTLPLASVSAKEGGSTSSDAAPEKPLMSRTITSALQNGRILLNFENIDVRVLSRMMSELTGRNIIVDEKVKGKITILSSREVTIGEAWDIFKAALDRYGFRIKETGSSAQILPVADVRSLGRVVKPGLTDPNGDEYVMAVLILNQGNPENIEKAVKPLISENGILTSYKEGLALLVVDRAAIVNRVGRIVKSLDRLEPTLKTSVVFPKYMEAEKVVDAIKPLYKEKENRNEFGIAAFAPSNGVVITAYPQDLISVKRVLQRLDIPMAAPTKTEPARFFVYNLQFAQAEDVAKILSEMLSERQKAVEDQLKESKVPATENKDATNTANNKFPDVASTTTGPTGAADKPPTVGFTSSKVSADAETNSLVLYVSPSEYDELKSVIAKLDSERRQVQISAVVAEVSLNRARDIGIQWQALTPGGIIGSYQGGLTEEGLLNVLAGGNFVVGTVGGNTRTITISNQDVEVPEFFAFADMMDKNSDFNLISAPRVLTQDNKEAVINVGQVVPFATGGKLDAYGSPVVTFDYREVGIKLEVTPHLSRTGKIRMDVNQEIQEVTDYLNQEMAGVKFSAPVVSNRSVKTTVTIPDGKTLLIGGLISKSTSDSVKGVPILKDIPLLGWLFRNKSTEEKKVSIFISLTPKIINLDDPIQQLDQPLKPFLDYPGDSGDQQNENRDTISPFPAEESPDLIINDDSAVKPEAAPNNNKSAQDKAAQKKAAQGKAAKKVTTPKVKASARKTVPPTNLTDVPTITPRQKAKTAAQKG